MSLKICKNTAIMKENVCEEHCYNRKVQALLSDSYNDKHISIINAQLSMMSSTLNCIFWSLNLIYTL